MATSIIKSHSPTFEKILVVVGVVVALAATVGITRFQMAWSDRFFTGNALMYGVSQLGSLVSLVPFRPRATTFVGVSLLNASYLIWFNFWVFASPHPDGGAWGIYFIALIAGTIGAVKAVRWLRYRSSLGPWMVGAISASFALIGILVVHGVFLSLHLLLA